MTFRYSEKKADIDQQALSHLMESCAVQFNSFVAEDFFNNDNLVAAFFVPSESVKVYEELCSKYCPSHSADFYRIDLDFVMKLGRAYLSVISGMKFRF